ncbi:Hypothetical protein LUCI_0277 [Lucifera butyrica]|uniref:Uncharacterized protein n=1 Tax=Lucifera butyrica TaxID=1351585 RepID=A0A498R164_9FIRM|nr:hypothetical protein [Lucifera butyrica]VBB05071.1 Hypothetical protein LUCI_0277 [Lucifera butyrica]
MVEDAWEFSGEVCDYYEVLDDKCISAMGGMNSEACKIYQELAIRCLAAESNREEGA